MNLPCGEWIAEATGRFGAGPLWRSLFTELAYLPEDFNEIAPEIDSHKDLQQPCALRAEQWSKLFAGGGQIVDMAIYSQSALERCVKPELFHIDADDATVGTVQSSCEPWIASIASTLEGSPRRLQRGSYLEDLADLDDASLLRLAESLPG